MWLDLGRLAERLILARPACGCLGRVFTFPSPLFTLFTFLYEKTWIGRGIAASPTYTYVPIGLSRCHDARAAAPPSPPSQLEPAAISPDSAIRRVLEPYHSPPL